MNRTRRGMRGRGDRGEDIALEYLVGLGYRLVRRNYQTRYGEIDLILHDGHTLVFVEVKARKDAAYGDPLEAVTQRKQRRIAALAEQYIAQEEPDFEEVRFDVVGILASGRGGITHVEDAFQVS